MFEHNLRFSASFTLTIRALSLLFFPAFLLFGLNTGGLSLGKNRPFPPRTLPPPASRAESMFGSPETEAPEVSWDASGSALGDSIESEEL
jgi:hypothetical protein